MHEHVYTIAETCESAGIRHVVICPGSRSAPLVIAFTENRSFTCYTVIDERSAAYMALGMAQQLKEPVALICTSGTASLNFYPAIAEAFYQRVPLLVLTADRPPELLNQQDGQMISQVSVFEKNITASYSLPAYAPGRENPLEAGKITAAALAECILQKGPVHINIPLREPLYDPAKAAPAKPFALPSQKPQAVPDVSGGISEDARIMIIVGQNPADHELFSVLRDISLNTDAIILCDIASNQHSVCTAQGFDMIVSQADEKTLRQLEPDVVISVCGPVLSKSLKLWLKKQKPQHHFRIGPESSRIDTYNNATSFVKGDPSAILRGFHSSLSGRHENKTYKKLWQGLNGILEYKTTAFLKSHPFSELHATQIILAHLPDACNLHLANSSPVRYASYLAGLDASWTINANRGTSGIDGCTSTAVGAAIVNNRQTVLVTGDLGFLYDRNALWNHHVPDNLRIIVINNNGGGIFSLIDGPSSRPGQLKYFTTPHKTPVKNAALDNGLEYYFCDSADSLEKELRSFFNDRKSPSLLEIRTDMKSNMKIFRAFKKIKLV